MIQRCGARLRKPIRTSVKRDCTRAVLRGLLSPPSHESWILRRLDPVGVAGEHPGRASPSGDLRTVRERLVSYRSSWRKCWRLCCVGLCADAALTAPSRVQIRSGGQRPASAGCYSRQHAISDTVEFDLGGVLMSPRNEIAALAPAIALLARATRRTRGGPPSDSDPCQPAANAS